jgi:hypothetical protein
MDLDGTILLEYSGDNGGSWNQIASHQDNTGFYLWNTSTVPDGDHYLIAVSTIDEFLNIGSDTSNTAFTINNFATETPQISGPTQGGNGIRFNFTAVAFHPEGEQIYYKVKYSQKQIPMITNSLKSLHEDPKRFDHDRRKGRGGQNDVCLCHRAPLLLPGEEDPDHIK